jgi:Arc/MetJ-type ribon-helix-helix transcriptional regulator
MELSNPTNPFYEIRPTLYTFARRGAKPMKVELTPDAAIWVEAELAAGRFATAEDAVRFAINEAKTAILRAEIKAAELEGGRFTSDEVRRFARGHLDASSPGR